MFANQSSLQTAQHSAGTKKRLPSCARAGEGGPMEIRRRSWEIMGDTGQGGNQRIDRGDRGRSREIMRGRGRSIEVDRDRAYLNIKIDQVNLDIKITISISR